MALAQPPAVVHAGPALATALHTRANPAPHGWQVHVVRRGETVSGLSLTYRTTISTIVAKNRLGQHGRLIHPGQAVGSAYHGGRHDGASQGQARQGQGDPARQEGQGRNPAAGLVHGPPR